MSDTTKKVQFDPASLPGKSETATKIKPVQASNTFRGLNVNAFNFPTADFRFYQLKQPFHQGDYLTQNRLRGALKITDYHTNIANTEFTLANSDGDNLTFECWVKVDPNTSYGSNTTIFWLSGSFYVKLLNPANLTLTLTGSSTINTGKSLIDGLWHHVAVVLKKGSKPEIYVDTRMVSYNNSGVQNFTGISNNTYSLYGGNYGTSSSYYLQNGEIAEMRVWKSARTQAEIIYNAGRHLFEGEESDLLLYWSSDFDEANSTVIDSSGNGNDGTITHSNQTQVWDNSSLFGALLDSQHIVPDPTNMSGAAVFNEYGLTTWQAISKEFYDQEVSFPGITLEIWVKAYSTCNSSSEICSVYNRTANEYVLALRDPTALTIHMNDGNIATNIDLTDGKWHAIALTCVSGETPKLYVDTRKVDLSASSHTCTFNTSFIPDVFMGPSNLTHCFLGELSEFRVWTTARTQEEILRDASYRTFGNQEGLLLYWPIARDFDGTFTEDFASGTYPGQVHGYLTWNNNEVFGLLANGFAIAPPIEDSDTSGPNLLAWQNGDLDWTALVSEGTIFSGAAEGFPSVTKQQLQDAFDQAQGTGYFDAVVFPNISIVKKEDHEVAKEAIADITFDIFLKNWVGGLRLNLSKDGDGDMDYSFIPLPKGYGPTLLLLFDTEVHSFYSYIGEGQVVRSFSLMPGESTYASIETYKNSTSSKEKTDSIFDSNSRSAQDSFENARNSEFGLDAGAALAFDFHEAAENKDRWGFGNLDVSENSNFSLSANLNGHAQMVSNALQTHAQEVSAQRDVNVNTSYTVTTESGKETAVTREFKNINNSCTLNILFRQMNQEFAIAHTISNVRIAYFDPVPGSYRAVQLYELEDLLDQVLLDDQELKMDYMTRIINYVYAIENMMAGDQNDAPFIQYIDKTTGALGDPSDLVSDGKIALTGNEVFLINRKTTTNFSVNDNDTARVNGVVLSHDKVVMRTDNVVADLVLGEGVGLDDYAAGLQKQTVRRERVENQRIEMENVRMDAALAILDKAQKEGMSATDIAALYKELFVNGTPNKTVIFKDGSQE